MKNIIKNHFNALQLNAAQFFDKISAVYKNGLVYHEKFIRQFDNGYKALRVFLDTYAYARQGAAAAHPQIACECISREYVDAQNWHKPTISEAKHLWSVYRKIAMDSFNLLDKKTGKVKVNGDCNPMNSDKGIIFQLASNNIENIAGHVRTLIKNGNTHNAYDFIKSIKGIGDKIASFYLRDIAHFADDIEESDIVDVHLLQPIDTWLEQILKILFNSDIMKLSLRNKQKQIVNLCREAKVSCLSFNQGAWLFGSQIAEDFERVESAITDTEKALLIIEKHIDKKQRYLHELSNVLKILKKEMWGQIL